MSLRRATEELERTAPEVVEAARLIVEEIRGEANHKKGELRGTEQLIEDVKQLFVEDDDPYLTSLPSKEREIYLKAVSSAFLLGALGATAVQTESL